MKNIVICFVTHLMLLSACQNSQTIQLRAPQTFKGVILGDSVLDHNIKIPESLLAFIVHGDIVKAKLRAKVKTVSKKGTWLTLDNIKGKEIIVSAKDGAFDFPQSLVGKEIVLDGEAKLGTLSVNEQAVFDLEEDNKPVDGREIKKIKDVVFFEAKSLAIL